MRPVRAELLHAERRTDGRTDIARLKFLFANLGARLITTLLRTLYTLFYWIKYIFGMVARSYSVRVLSEQSFTLHPRRSYLASLFSTCLTSAADPMNSVCSLFLCLEEIRLLSRFRSLELKASWKTPNIMTLVSAWDLFKKGNRQMLSKE
jgi:hypothetical protein